MKRETKWEHSSSTERCTRYSDFTFTEPVVSKEDNAVSTWLRCQRLVLHYAVCLLHLWQSAVINFNLTSDSDRREKKKNLSWKKKILGFVMLACVLEGLPKSNSTVLQFPSSCFAVGRDFSAFFRLLNLKPFSTVLGKQGGQPPPCSLLWSF